MKAEKSNLSLVENERGNNKYKKEKLKMKQHFIAIMEQIVSEHQKANYFMS